MKKFEIYFFSTKYGNNPEDWEQEMIIEASDRREAWEIFKQKTGVLSGNDLDYLDIMEVA